MIQLAYRVVNVWSVAISSRRRPQLMGCIARLNAFRQKPHLRPGRGERPPSTVREPVPCATHQRSEHGGSTRLRSACQWGRMPPWSRSRPSARGRARSTGYPDERYGSALLPVSAGAASVPELQAGSPWLPESCIAKTYCRAISSPRAVRTLSPVASSRFSQASRRPWNVPTVRGS